MSGYVPTIGQGMAANAASAVNQAGEQITNRALNTHPAIRIRPGFSVNVLVTKDMILTPCVPGPAVAPADTELSALGWPLAVSEG